jgi:hypothetical protein
VGAGTICGDAAPHPLLRVTLLSSGRALGCCRHWTGGGTQVTATSAALSEARARPWAEWWPSVRFGILAGVAARIATEILVVVGLFGAAAIPQLMGRPWTTLVSPWLQWDANWQVAIAQWGYGFSFSDAHHTYASAAFQPVLPGSMAAVASLTGMPVAVAGLVVVTLALAIALVGLHRLVALDYGGQAAALAVILLLVYPTAVFLGAPYAEPLVLAEVVWAFLAVRRERWLLAGALVGLAILTKLFAAAFAIPLLVEAMSLAPPNWRLRAKAAVLTLLGPLTGMVGLGICYGLAFHDPLRVLVAEQQWSGRQIAPPFVAIWNGFHPMPQLTIADAAPIADLVSLGLLLAAAAYSWVRLRRAYAVALIVLFLTFTSSSVPTSISRWTLDAFPVFIAGGVLLARRRWLIPPLVMGSSAAMVLFLWIYSHGGWAG